MFNCKTLLLRRSCSFFECKAAHILQSKQPAMRPEKNKRVEINPAQQGLAGLGSVLDGLNLGPLPDAPTVAKPAESVKQRRLGRVILRRETAHRGGKAVIVIHDFPTEISDEQLEILAKRLRQALGTGGTVKGRTIEMQGEQAVKVRAFLENDGFQVAGV